MTRETELDRVERLESARFDLMRAAKAGDANLLRSALRRGAEVDFQDLCGETALMIASSRGQDRCAQALLAAGANIQAPDPRGETALMRAIFHGKAETAIALLKAGADPAATDDRGMSALRWALARRSQELCEALIAAGAAEPGVCRQTWRDAIRYGALGALVSLRGQGVSPKAPQGDASLLFELMGARSAEAGDPGAIAVWLARELADELDQKNERGQTPLEAFEPRRETEPLVYGALKAAWERREMERLLKKPEGLARSAEPGAPVRL